jgi:hypothetical protein
MEGDSMSVLTSEARPMLLCEIAAHCGVPVKRLGDLLFRGQIDRNRVHLVGGRVVVPPDYLSDVIAAANDWKQRKAERTAKAAGASETHQNAQSEENALDDRFQGMLVPAEAKE